MFRAHFGVLGYFQQVGKPGVHFLPREEWPSAHQYWSIDDPFLKADANYPLVDHYFLTPLKQLQQVSLNSPRLSLL